MSLPNTPLLGKTIWANENPRYVYRGSRPTYRLATATGLTSLACQTATERIHSIPSARCVRAKRLESDARSIHLGEVGCAAHSDVVERRPVVLGRLWLRPQRYGIALP